MLLDQVLPMKRFHLKNKNKKHIEWLKIQELLCVEGVLPQEATTSPLWIFFRFRPWGVSNGGEAKDKPWQNTTCWERSPFMKLPREANKKRRWWMDEVNPTYSCFEWRHRWASRVPVSSWRSFGVTITAIVGVKLTVTIAHFISWLKLLVEV